MLQAGEPGAVFVWKMFRTLTLFTEPLASLKKIPNNPGPRKRVATGRGKGERESGCRAGDGEVLDVHRRGTGGVGDHRPGVGVGGCRWVAGADGVIRAVDGDPVGTVNGSVVLQSALNVQVLPVLVNVHTESIGAADAGTADNHDAPTVARR